MHSGHSALRPVLRKLDRLSPLTESDRITIAALPFRYEQVAAGRQLVREGDRPTECCVLLSGYAFRSKDTQDGKRQILSFHVAGDFLDLQQMKLAEADHAVYALGTAEIAWVSHVELECALRSSPTLADALWRDALVDSSILREWVLNVGRRDARARIAHMLCEFATRREAAEVGTADQFELPMTQEHIADATGLTVVHVNRMLRALTQAGAIAHGGRLVHIVDWKRLREIAGFDPAYLHMAVWDTSALFPAQHMVPA